MARRKKHMKLPNGYGSICYLGSNRRRPYAVYPPTTEFNLNGSAVRPKAIGYAEDYYKAYEMLVAWRTNAAASAASPPQQNQPAAAPKGPTFAEVYSRFYHDKYEVNTSRKYSASALSATRTAYKNCSVLHDKVFNTIRYEDLQGVVDGCELKHASLELIVTLFKQVYQYALKYDLTDKDYSRYLEIKKADDDEHGVPFTQDDLHILWQHTDDDTIAALLVMIYSGYRISAWKTMRIDLKGRYFEGGVKTAASKNRIVPMHSAIYPLTVRLLDKCGSILPAQPYKFRKDMDAALEQLGICRHTPHDCRHTFSALCEQYGVNDNDRRRLLGHAFKDVTNKVYGHRSLDDLRTEIEKIHAPV